jgi:multiple sugar transport system substrate-binding protein
VESATWNGRLYGVPFGINALTMYYNKDLFNKAGLNVPTTWDELRDAAKKLTTPTVNGILISAKPTEEGTFNFLPYVWSAGATAFDINNSGGIKALEFVASLVSDGSMSREVVNMSMDDVKNQFIAGNTAMMVNGPWQVAGIRQSVPNLNWGVSLIPKDREFAAGLDGENIGIIGNKNVDASLAFVNYIIRPDFQTTYFDILGISANKDVAAKQFPNDQIMQGFVNQQQYAHPRGPHPRWPEISDAISLAFNQVITRQKTAAEAAKIAQDAIDRIK